MLHYNELRITPDNKYLIVDVSVDADDYYEDVVIDSIVIDTQETFIVSGPSSSAVYTYICNTDKDETFYLPQRKDCNVFTDNTYVYNFTDKQGRVKNIRLHLKASDLGVTLENNMFFVYAVASGVPAPTTPCGMDTYIKMGCVANLQPFYQSIMSQMKEVSSDCLIPKNFINSILRYKALELNVKSGNYPKAIEYWNKYFSNLKLVTPTTNCGCHG